MRGPTSGGQLLAVVAGALALGLAVVAPPASAAVDDRDFAAVHRLTVGLYAVAHDDQDSVIGTSRRGSGCSVARRCATPATSRARSTCP